jgi:protein associated with RNAse G/E
VTGRDVRVVYTKYDGSLHWHQTMRYLGEDEHGVWLGAPAGLIARKGDGPAVIIEQPHVMLFPQDAWWTAAFNGAPARTEIYCDISTPPQWSHPGEVTMIDLDLDVVRRRADQRIVLLDQDEFAEHQRRYDYPADVIRQAEHAAAWLQETIAAGAEPFAGGYLSWFDRVPSAPGT